LNAEPAHNLNLVQVVVDLPVNKVDLSKQLLLVEFQFAHHFLWRGERTGLILEIFYIPRIRVTSRVLIYSSCVIRQGWHKLHDSADFNIPVTFIRW
jgi:hypothetical protein